MTVETDLQSEEAVRDVAAVLREATGPDIERGVACVTEGWDIVRVGAWIQLKRYDGGPDLAVYYRAEGDRFIVTDLGAAVRALRLRTGLTPHEADVAASRVLMTERGVPRWWVPNTCVGSAIEIPHGVPAADLPRAIVRVMLAAHRVASLEVPC